MESYNFEALRSKHFACVYKLVFPNGKIYVGKSKDIGKRISVYNRKCDGSWAERHNSPVDVAIREFGVESISVEIMFSVNYVSGVDKERDLDYALGIVEMRWIKEFGSSKSDVGYNATDGGEMFGVREMERVKEIEKTRVVYNDVVVDRERERQTNGVPVVGYDINGDFIGEWPSRVAFTRDVIHAKGTLDYGVWRKGFIMYEKNGGDYPKKVESYAEYIERTKSAEIEAKRVLEEKVGKIKVRKDVRICRSVVLVDSVGNEIGRFENIRDAAEETGIRYSSIYSCLKKGYGKVGGFSVYWSDEWDEDPSACVRSSIEKKISYKRGIAEESIKRERMGKIHQYDMSYNEIGVFDNVSEAAKHCGYDKGVIYSALNRGFDALGGIYHWRCDRDMNKEAKKIVEEEREEDEKPPKTLFDGFSSEEF